MAAALEAALTGLHECLGDDPSLGGPRALDNVANLAQICLGELPSKETAYCCSLLFNKRNGVVTFLENVVLQDEYQSAKAELLELLLAFAQKEEKKILPYAVDVKKVCVSLFTRDKYAKVKNIAIQLLIELLRQSSGTKMAEDLQIESLIQKFFMELTKTSKHSTTVKQQIYVLLGVLAEIFPENMVNYSDRLLELYVKTLRTEMTSKTKKPELPLIAGCIQGLNHLLVHFTQSADEGAKFSYDIFRFALKAVNRDLHVTRYEMPRCALQLLGRHAPQFNQYLLDDYQVVFENLAFWSGHQNRDVMHAGMNALSAFFKQVAEVLVRQAKRGQKDGSVFKFFIEQFRDVMDNPKSTPKEVAMAIRGYGYFAAPCRMFLKAEDVKFMFTEMIHRSEWIFFNQTETAADQVINLPGFLEALASIVREMEQVADTFLVALERLMVALLDHFPRLPRRLHHTCFVSLLVVCYAMATKAAAFTGFLARFVYQALMRTCSHPAVVDGDEPEVSEEDLEAVVDRVSYKDYLPFWKTMLGSAKVKQLAELDITLAQRQHFTEALYDQLLQAILLVLDRLDLSACKVAPSGEQDDDIDEDPASPVTSDPAKGLQAARPKDFIVFINVVDFCTAFLPDNHVTLFQKWMYTYSRNVILHSTRLPIVSGLYRMLSVCAKIASSTSYFKGLGEESQDGELRPLEAEPPIAVKMEPGQSEGGDDVTMEEVSARSERERVVILLSKFCKEVAQRMRQYKGELLSACLGLLLAMPQQIVISQLDSLVAALLLTMRVGRSYLPLAHTGLDALERWATVLPPSVMRPHYSTILPCLDAYLKYSSPTGDDSIEHTVSLVSTAPSKRAGSRKINVKLLAKKAAGVKKDNSETELEVVRRRCVTLLGSLGGAVNVELVQGAASEIGKTAVAWDQNQHLKFDIPFVDIKPTIYLDAFLPRVVELATTSSERQTKVAACELLHSLTLYTLGRSSQQADGARTAPRPLHLLYAKLFPALLTLSCDVEQVASQLFEPLMMQLVHWFTGAKMFGSDETKVLLDALMDGLVSQSDPALRDFCARCVKEFLVWSIKQTSKEQMERSPYNAKMLVKQIYSLARHPSAYYRLGAAMAFNSIYSVFRSEDALVDLFTFEILVVFVESLALGHRDEKHLGVQEQCKQVLQHLERIIKVKADMLSHPSNKRRKPREWKDASLGTAVRWLLRQCGRPQTDCRHACMQLVCQLAPAVPGVADAKFFFDAMLKDFGAAYFIQRFESGMYKGGAGKQGLAQRPTMAHVDDAFTVHTALAWFDLLLATLDCYSWVFSEGLLSPATTLVAQGHKGTVLFQVLDHFLKRLACEDLEAAADLFPVKSRDRVYSPREREDYNRGKCTVIARMVYFISVILGRHKTETLKVVPSSLWCDELWAVVGGCVLKPAAVGFNMADVEVVRRLPEEMKAMMTVLMRNLPETTKKKLTNALAAKLATSDFDLPGQLPLPLADLPPDPVSLCHLTAGYDLLEGVGVLGAALKGSHGHLAAKLLDNVCQGLTVLVDGKRTVVALKPTAAELANSLLKLAFSLQLPVRDVIAALLDVTSLRSADGQSDVTLGATFYATYRSTLNAHLVCVASESIPALMAHAQTRWSVVGTVLVGIADHVSRDRSLRQRCGESLVGNYLDNWRQLKGWWSGEGARVETKALAVSLLTKLVLIDSKVVGDGKRAGLRDVSAMYRSLLTDKNTSLAAKDQVLDLLSYFASLPEDRMDNLRSDLDTLVAESFPVYSTEYASGSPKYCDYIHALNKILSALELSGSLMLLEVVLSILCKERRHVHEDAIQTALANFVRGLPRHRHKMAAEVPFRIFLKEGSFQNDQRRASLERVCLRLLQRAHQGALREFFLDHIKEITDIIEAKPVKTSEAAMETQLVSKLGAFKLVELMYTRLHKDDVSSKNSSINQKFCGAKAEKGSEMTMALTKAAHAAKGENVRDESGLRELRRLYHCAAYSALIAVVSCTQTEVKFYNVFLFQENPAKGQLLWDNLVDLERTYIFPLELEKAMTRQKRFVSIRKEVREREEGAGDRKGEGEAGGHSASVHYLASQYLADSSLGADVTQHDFTRTLSASALPGSLGGSHGAREHRPSSSTDVTDEDVEVTVTDEYVEMEMDEVNSHECMAPLTALLKHMAANHITPPTDKSVSPTSLPVWMENLHRRLEDSSTHINVKIFIAKLIVNTEEVFRPYARSWMAPLVQLITQGQLGSQGNNYFIMDLAVTLLSWHTVAVPQDTPVDRSMASRLLEFLMQHCHSQNNDILKNNLELIKTLVEVWRGTLNMPTKIMFDNFSEKDAKSKRNTTGIQLVGVVVANKLEPFRPGCGVDKDRFYKVLAMNMQLDSRQVYTASAEVVGLTLSLLAAHPQAGHPQAAHPQDPEWRRQYVDNVAVMLLAFQDAKPDKFISCVYRIQLHFPEIADRFLNQLLFVLPKLHGEYKHFCLDILGRRVDNVQNVFMQMKNRDLLGMLYQRNEVIQSTSLRLVHGMLRYLTPDQLLYLLPAVTAFREHPSASCRALMYDIVTWVYDNYREEEGADADKIMTVTKDCLLQALTDTNVTNRIRMENFWSDGRRLVSGTVDRMVAMLEAMYSPVTEHHFLAYSTNLLLEMTSRSPDYGRDIFEHPLSECKFEDYRVNSSWRQRHAVMTPLFVETQASLAADDVNGGASALPSDASLLATQVRATQDVQQFSATQEPGGVRAPYNWLTQSSLDTYADSSLTVGLETQSSLLFSVGDPPRGAADHRPGPFRRRPGPGPQFGKTKPGGAKNQESQGDAASSDILRLKRRFVKDSGARQAYHAKKMARLKRFQEEVDKKQKLVKENQVTMYRKYRTGELPDIQIKYSYIIAPLQALAQRDSTISRLLFSAIFRAIFAELESVKTERETRETIAQIQASLGEMLAASTAYRPEFIGSLLDIVHGSCRHLTLDTGSVYSACLASSQQPMGVLLLEEMLIQSEGEAAEKPRKRARLTQTASSPHTSTWLELARLYKSLGDYDVLRGIFSSRLGTQPLTSKALEAEARGDYKAAAKLYSEALSCDDWQEAPSDVEQDLWDEGRLQCYDHLTNWQRLEQYTEEAIDDRAPPHLERVWEDTYSQDHYIPYLLRSKVKLLLEGTESTDRTQILLSFVDEAMKHPERKALLETRYWEELTLLYICQEDYDRAKYYVHQASDLFLQDWSSLSVAMADSRATKMQALQKIVEMREFLDFIEVEENFCSVQPTCHLVEKWSRRALHAYLDPPGVWDDVIANRCLFTEQLSVRLEQAGHGDKRTGSDIMERHRVLWRLDECRAASLQDNFPVALKHMKNILETVKALGEEELSVRWAHTYAHTHHRRCQVLPINAQERIRAALGTLDTLDKHSGLSVIGRDVTLGPEHHQLKGQARLLIAQALIPEPRAFNNLPDDLLQRLQTAAKTTSPTIGGVLSGLMEEGYQLMKAAVCATGEGARAGTGAWGATPQETAHQPHMALVRYCDHYLRLKEEEEPGTGSQCPSLDSFPGAVTSSLLTAMRLSCGEAQQWFPRLLQLVELYPDTMDTFISKSRDVPCWMYIIWISQMTALLDKPQSPAIQGILESLAAQYPEALVYPFKLSSEGYQLDRTAAGKQAKKVKDSIEAQLAKNRLNDKFIKALQQFGQPNHLFRDWCMDGQLQRLLSGSKQNAETIRKLYQDMFRDLLDVDAASEADLYDASDPGGASLQHMGPYRTRFAKAFAKEVIGKFGKDGSKLLSLTPKKFSEEAKSLWDKMNKMGEAGTPPATLKEYSPWLAAFQGADHDQHIEIPGQYTGQSKPLPEYHTMISSFSENVKVMASIRKPKRVTVLGNDEKSYMFLVKGGEDLRQDQRVEQLFHIMNDVFRHDAACRARRLRLRTYQVIPMTTRVGLIEWMQHTIPLKEFLLSHYTPEERAFIGSDRGPQKDYAAWLGNESTVCRLYVACYKRYSRSDTVTAFKKREALVPWDLSRRAYLALSATPEGFFTLRSNLGRSHAQLSVCQYILGIGDRHLSNFMVDQQTGAMVGIDFGHAFGSATSFLEVPELMPFRLTRQIRNLLLPLREKGLLEGTMVHVLRALRHNSALLLNTMDVFIQEPSLDWKNFALKQAKYSGPDDAAASGDTDWYPKEKVAIARKKLEGGNSAHLTRRDLRAGVYNAPSKAAALATFERVLMGEAEHDIRARLPERGLTVEEQVACLLNHATDPNILGRVYGGWEAWV